MNRGTTLRREPGTLRSASTPAVWQSPASLESWIGSGPPARQGAAQHRTNLASAAAEARAALHEAARAAAEAATRARTVADELDAVLASLREQEGGLTSEPRPGKPIAPAGAASLSPREQEVLALVAEGRTNKAIAEALYVSPNTVKTHVASLLTKLDAHTRVQLATMAAQHGWHRA